MHVNDPQVPLKQRKINMQINILNSTRQSRVRNDRRRFKLIKAKPTQTDGEATTESSDAKSLW